MIIKITSNIVLMKGGNGGDGIKVISQYISPKIKAIMNSVRMTPIIG